MCCSSNIDENYSPHICLPLAEADRFTNEAHFVKLWKMYSEGFDFPNSIPLVGALKLGNQASIIMLITQSVWLGHKAADYKSLCRKCKCFSPPMLSTVSTDKFGKPIFIKGKGVNKVQKAVFHTLLYFHTSLLNVLKSISRFSAFSKHREILK